MRLLLLQCPDSAADRAVSLGANLAEALRSCGIECREASAFWSPEQGIGSEPAFRTQLRSQINALVDEFDPQMIHSLSLWPWAQLALETGVPYVVSVGRSELQMLWKTAELLPWVVQGIENAGAIVVEAREMSNELIRLFPEIDVQTICSCGNAAELVELYSAVRRRRTGNSNEYRTDGQID
jgi:hypothetical protein